MKILLMQVRRNVKLFFKDKVMFLTSLITPIILLVLYVTFLARVFRSVYVEALPPETANKVINGAVAGQLISSLLSVCTVTVAFCANMLMVNDKITGVREDMHISSIPRGTLAASYYIATMLCTFIVCGAAAVVGFIYIGAVGWYLSVADVLLTFVDVVLMTLFGTALSSLINFFLSSQGQVSAVGTIVSAGYGFVSGAYMPISQCGKVMGGILSCLPGSFGTFLLRNHLAGSAIAHMPAEAVQSLRDSVDANLYFFGHSVSQGAAYGVLIGATAIVLAAYILLCVFVRPRSHRAPVARKQPA